MTADREALSGEIARVLGEHVLREVDPACSCGWDWDYREVILPSAVDFDSTRYRLPHTVRPEQHRAHLADALADLLAARERGVRAGALREAADAFDDDDTAIDVALSGVDYVIAVLRDRADRIEAEE